MFWCSKLEKNVIRNTKEHKKYLSNTDERKRKTKVRPKKNKGKTKVSVVFFKIKSLKKYR